MKNSKFKYELKKQFDDLIYEIVKTITPTIEKINNLMEEKNNEIIK